ncbi:MAG: SDR family oxidoreductase [Pseudomonadales bacterium]|nr:SDR family oxidoreductase [Pseudomonadales bacterium]
MSISPILVITGASKGIGFKTALKFLGLGYRVINLSRTPAPHDDIENYQIDLTQPDAEAEIKSFVDTHLKKTKICLVHNAAMLLNDTAQGTDSASFKDVLNLNVVAPHILNQHIIPFMSEDSSIIYIGSTLSEKAVSNAYSYIVSKHAIIGMMKACCQDLAGTGIHTSCICPGFTDTEMLRQHVGESVDSLAKLSTFGRIISPSEIANTIEFAALNPVINGAVLHANLGQVES